MKISYGALYTAVQLLVRYMYWLPTNSVKMLHLWDVLIIRKYLYLISNSQAEHKQHALVTQTSHTGSLSCVQELNKIEENHTTCLHLTLFTLTYPLVLFLVFTMTNYPQLAHGKTMHEHFHLTGLPSGQRSLNFLLAFWPKHMCSFFARI